MMSPPEIDSEVPLGVTLTAAEWTAVINILADAPYRVVAPLIKKIAEQAQHAALAGTPRPNGHDAASPAHTNATP
jgi:hypothetical protein